MRLKYKYNDALSRQLRSMNVVDTHRFIFHPDGVRCNGECKITANPIRLADYKLAFEQIDTTSLTLLLQEEVF